MHEIIIKLNFYISKYKIKTLAIGGGVSANKALIAAVKKLPIKVFMPDTNYTGDNAAMIAMYAYLLKR